MKLASERFSEEDLKLISEAVKKAEAKTSGEIVPVVATVSGRYDRAEDFFGLVIAVAALSLAWLVFQDVTPAKGEWASGLAVIHLSLPAVLAIIALGFALGSATATIFPFLRLPFIRKQEMQEEVERAALEAFQRFRVRATAGSTGILIYVSLYERMVRVIGDDAISAKLDQETWGEVCQIMVAGMKDDNPAEGFVNAIEKCGQLLSENFPIAPGDNNEISNELRIID
ncbi:hypothetical protein MNBD_NITROSPINAE04-1323 [hydrothermal vent metagenome]|uniref:TPM domain-containing protein n=1 Tax=hydrothermal vent metagenome TaxID=652676 RepID=A0A3B1BWI0_9ZZZZ